MKQINWKCPRKDYALIDQIVERAKAEGLLVGSLAEDAKALCMDITAAHCNGNKLDLERWLAADKFNFAHDLCGIVRHIDRETGKLTNCFLPRFTARRVAA